MVVAILVLNVKIVVLFKAHLSTFNNTFCLSSTSLLRPSWHYDDKHCCIQPCSIVILRHSWSYRAFVRSQSCCRKKQLQQRRQRKVGKQMRSLMVSLSTNQDLERSCLKRRGMERGRERGRG